MSVFRFEDLSNSINNLFLKMDRIEKLLEKINMDENSDENSLLTIEQAAKLLRLSTATIYTKVCKNEIPVCKQGKRLYFEKAELLDWIKSGRIKTVSEIQMEAQLMFNNEKRHH